MDNIYELGTSKILKIGVLGNGNNDLLYNFINEIMFDTIKICPYFISKIDLVEENKINKSNEYNFLFYFTKFEKINEEDTFNSIKKISSEFDNPRNHLFVVIDECTNLKIDDDGDLVSSNENDEDFYQKFDETLSKAIDDKLFHTCRISLEMAKIWKKIDYDNSIVNLSEEQIDVLASILVKKSSKLSLSDKKREVKVALKKVVINDKIAESGYTDFYDNVSQYFKVPYQKKIVCQNYLSNFNKINITLKDIDMANINNLLREIYDITYLKTEIHDNLIDKIDTILLSKLENFYNKCKNCVVIDPKTQQYVDAYAYHKFLVHIMDISKGYNLSNIMEITKLEISTVNNLITEYHKKEMEHVTDLGKISSYLEIFATKDKSNLNSLFDKIRSHNKIIQENIEKVDKWITFIDKCLKIGVTKDLVVLLLEEIILAKISYYNGISRINNKEITLVYPLCLQIFLLSNINRGFIFKKLYMYASYSIRYSGRNISELIRNIKEDEYQSMLKMENKLLDICSTIIEEQSQPINLSEVYIVETFNENIINNDKKDKVTNIKKKNLSDNI